MSNSLPSKFLTGLGLSITILSGLSYLYYRYKKRETISKNWTLVGRLEDLYIYPIKSCPPIGLNEGICENLGFRTGDIKDRSFMIIEPNGQVIRTREYPQMANISTRIDNRSKLVFSAPGMRDLPFDFSCFGDSSHEDVPALIYGCNASVKDCGETYNKWFSQYILNQSEGLRLVYNPLPTPTRPIYKYYDEGITTEQDTDTSQDIASYHLVSNNTVNALNSDFKPVTTAQFRANFIIKTTGAAFEEDFWQWIRIGEEVVFKNIGPCFREFDANGNRLNTFEGYRRPQGVKVISPCMGVELGLRSQGVVKKGDSIFAILK